jgi:hypothetical protein
MNRTILLLIGSLLLTNCLTAQILPVKPVIQEQSQWCWVGSTKCVLDYYNHPLQQCEIAEYTRTVATWNNFGTVDCCTNPSGSCNYWNYNWGYAGSIQDLLVHFGNIQNYGKGAALSIPEIQTEINNFRPFIIRWGWTTGGGHFIIGHGLQDSTLYYMNPWFGEGLKFASYAWVKSNPDHTWTHTNVLTTNPAILTASVSALTIPAQAGNTRTFDITSNVAWTISCDQTWLTFNNTSGSGNSTITLNVTANPTNDARTSTVTLSGIGVSNQTITVIQDSPVTDVNEIRKNRVLMYPNPVTSDLTLTELTINSTISISDLNGKLLITGTAKSTTMKINLSGLINGVYILKVTDKNENKISKLIKQ